MSPSSCSSQDSDSDPVEDVQELRKKLSSIAWVQCDNTSCMKWRKVRLEVAQQLSVNTPWTCGDNEDQNFNRCSVPEEDTTQFDRLAKQAKLDVIRSELKPGALVWAKLDGYCRWPALVTADPANGEHMEGDDVEVLWYHVEFLGGKRSHSWVKSKFVMTFGLSNADLIADKRHQNTSSKKPKNRSKTKGKQCVASKGNALLTGKGNCTVQKAIEEALQLLPLPAEQRLATCEFVWTGEADIVSLDAGVPKVKKNKSKSCGKKQTTLNKNSCDSTLTEKNLRRSKRLQCNSCDKDSVLKENLTPRYFQIDREVATKHQNQLKSNTKIPKSVKVDENTKDKSEHFQCLDFPSSLLETSKEERFMIDVQLYQTNEQAFQHDVTRFMLRNGLKLAAAPVWQNMSISIFNLFLAVHERGGFEKVGFTHQWRSVYSEVAHQDNKNGSSIAKRFYKKNLYPYELYCKGQDYNPLVQELRQPAKQRYGQKRKIDTCDEDMHKPQRHCCAEDDDFDSPDVVRHLDELDQILKVLEEKELAKEDRLVPVVGSDTKLDNCVPRKFPLSPNLNIQTGSENGTAVVPEENAQVVPELDFPSSVEGSDSEAPGSAQSSQDEQVFHKMQALQYDMDLLEEHINSL